MRPLRRTAVHTGRGRPVWQLLTALVGVPLVAALVLGAALTRYAQADLAHARSSQEALRTSEQLDVVRRAVDAELLPTLVQRVAQERVLAQRAGLVAADGTDTGRQALLDRAPAELAAAREVTDAAAAAVDAPGALPAVRVAVDQLTVLRADADRGLHGVGALSDDYRYVADVLVVAEHEAAVEAAASRQSRLSAGAVSDVEEQVSTATSAVRQLPAALVACVTTGEDRRAALARWRASSGDLEHLDDPVEEPLSPALRQPWLDAVRSPASLELADRLAGGWALDPSSPQRLSGAALLALAPLSAERDAQLAALVSSAYALAGAYTSEDADAAEASLHLTAALSALALLAGVTAATALGRSLGRSLRQLDGAAHDLQQGRLVRHAAHGPRELRQVGAALARASQGLHRVRQQVEAVADGDLARAAALPAVPGHLGDAVHASVTSLVRAVRARDALRAELAHRAEHDPLTGLPNRAAATTALAHLVERSRSTGEQLAVLFVDLDGFKAVNDGCGHAAGDVLLRVVAERLRLGVRAEDVVSRLGGDEFVVVLGDVSAHDALTVADRLVALVGAPVEVPVGGDVRERTVGASIGMALGRAGTASAEQLLGRADTAVYRAKALGRGRVVLFDEELRRAEADREALVRDLREALARGEVTAQWEPQVLGADRALVGHRGRPLWRRGPDGEVVAPEQVERCAEEAGLGRALGRALLAQAAGLLDRPVPESDAPASVVVPLTDRHAADPAVLDDVADALVRAGRSPTSVLFVQVTERALGDPDVAANLHALRLLGVRTGVVTEGLTRLRDLPGTPVDVVVLAGSVVTDGERTEHVCRLVAGAATAAGLLVVAEGVTSAEQADRLWELGVVGMGGPHVGPPVLPAAPRVSAPA